MDISDGRFYYKVAVSSRKDVILVVCDWLSKITHFVAMTEMIIEGLVSCLGTMCGKCHIRQRIPVCS